MQPLFCALIVFCVLINVPNHKGSPEPIPNAKISIQSRTPFWAVNTSTHTYMPTCICLLMHMYGYMDIESRRLGQLHETSFVTER